MKLPTGWVTQVSLLKWIISLPRKPIYNQEVTQWVWTGKKLSYRKGMIWMLMTSGRIPTEDIGIHLPSGPHFPLVSAQIDGHLLTMLSLLIPQLPLPNWQVMKLIQSGHSHQSSQPCLEVILSLMMSLHISTANHSVMIVKLNFRKVKNMNLIQIHGEPMSKI